MSKQAISKHQAVLTLPKVDPASIDIKSWPSRERDERSNDPWWQSLGDDGRDEYAAAMDDIQSAKVQSDGSLVTSKRTFRFWAREKEYRPELTRLDWTAPDGQTYAFTYEPDMRLRDLADSDPLAAAKELSRRFVVCATDSAADCSGINDILHAAAIRHFFLPPSNEYRAHPWLEVDPWTGNFTMNIDDHEPFETGIPAVRHFNMESTSLQGPRTDKQLLMDPDQHEGNLGYDDPLEAFTPDLVIQLASEANAILGAAGLPMIEAENVAAKISKLRWCPLAFEQLQDHLKDRPKAVIEPYGMGSYGESYDNPKAYAAISDLATASSFRNGKIETDGGPYRVDSDPEAPSLMLVSKGLKRRKEGQEAFNIGTREIPSLIDDENKMLAFFRSLQSRLATNLSVEEADARVYLCQILALATNELVLARQSETRHGPIQMSAYVRCCLDGHVKICLGDSGYHSTGESIQLDPIILIEYENELRSFRVMYSDLWQTQGIAGMAANRLRISAEAVFRHFDLNTSKIEAAIDDFYRFRRL